MFQDVFTPESWRITLEVLVKAGIAVLLGGAIGWEREMHGKPSGVRTHMLVSLGALLFTEVGRGLGGDPARVAAQVVTGIGFLGAGTILRMGAEVRGLTTAASVWATASIAMAVSIGGPFMLIAFLATVLALVTLALVDDVVRRVIKQSSDRTIEVVLDDRAAVHDVLSIISSKGVAIRSVHMIDVDPNIELKMDLSGRTEAALTAIVVIPHVRSAKWID